MAARGKPFNFVSPVRATCRPDCPQRAAGCHSTCEGYKAYLQANETYKEEQHRAKHLEELARHKWVSKLDSGNMKVLHKGERRIDD